MEFTARSAYDDVMRPFDSYESKRRALDAEMLDQLGKLDESWPDDLAVPDLECELAVRHGISSHTASERLRIARALRQLPHIAMAHREGRLSWDQLRWVSRFATPETDAAWAIKAPSMRPLALRQESIRQHRATRLRAQQEEALRSFRMEWDEEHRLLEFYGTLVGDKAAAFEAAVKKAAQEITVEDDVDDRMGARQADALVGLVTSSGGRSRPATLVVHADAEVLARAREDATDEVVHRPANEATEEPGNEPSHKSTNEAPDGLTDECADRLTNDVSEGAAVEPATQAIDRLTVEPTDGKRLLADIERDPALIRRGAPHRVRGESAHRA
jgi:hypothetical protein